MKKIEWWVLIIPTVMVAVLFLGLRILSRVSEPPNYPMLVVGWLALSLFWLWLFGQQPGTRDSSWRDWWRILLLIPGVIGWLWLLPGSGVALAAAAGPGIGSTRFQSVVLSTLPIAGGYLLFCILAITSRFEVPEGKVTVLDGQILYPGTHFRLWPWFSYQVKELGPRIKVPPTKLTATFRDGTFDVEIESSVGLDIAQAREEGIQHLDPEMLAEGVREWALEHFREYTGFTLGEFLRMRPPLTSGRISGFPVAWKGDYRLRFEFARDDGIKELGIPGALGFTPRS